MRPRSSSQEKQRTPDAEKNRCDQWDALVLERVPLVAAIFFGVGSTLFFLAAAAWPHGSHMASLARSLRIGTGCGGAVSRGRRRAIRYDHPAQLDTGGHLRIDARGV